MKQIFIFINLLGVITCRPSSFLVRSPDGGRLSKRQAADNVKITKLTVTSQIQFRYSRTVVESQVKNFGDAAAMTEFKMVIPDSAFISNFSMVAGNKEYVGEVKPKEEAKKDFEQLLDQGVGAGLVEKETRDANVFHIKTNVEPAGKVVFRLTYDELLERRFGLYEQALHVQPGQIVEDFKIFININESLPITKLSVPELKNSNDIDFNEKETKNSIATIHRDVDNDSSKAVIELDISSDYQKSFGAKGVQGEFLVQYDVDRKNQSSEIQVIDGHFVHFFAPENLKTLPKHVIFVLDISGSMWGEKLSQLKDAMFTILDEMTDKDYFDIITFSSRVKKWKPASLKETSAFKASEENKELGINFILQLSASGGTNINSAVQEALNLGIETKKKELVNSGVATMILFMTDGQPTEGITDRKSILNNIKSANTEAQLPIFSLAFGADADFELMVDMSKETKSHAKQIYEGSDAALQLEGFYQEISSPLLSDVKFKYIGNNINDSTLTNSELKTFFKGTEYVTAGQLSNLPDNEFKIEIEAHAGPEVYKEHITICVENRVDHFNPDVQIYPLPSPCYVPPKVQRSEAQTFLKNLYTFLQIKQLLSKDDAESKEKAVKMSLEGNFVTDVTSLIVKRENEVQPTALSAPKSQQLSKSIQTYASPAGFRVANRNGPPASYLGFQSLAYVPANAYAPSVGLPGFSGPVDYFASYDDDQDYEDYQLFNSAQQPFTSTPPVTTTTTTATTTTTSGLCRITLYAKTYHRGDSLELEDASQDLGDFNDRSVSARLEGSCCWTLYSQTRFTGDQVTLNPARSTYTSVSSLNRLMRNTKSVRKVACS